MQTFSVAILLAFAEVTSTQFVGTWEGKVNDLPAIEITIVRDQAASLVRSDSSFSSAGRMAVGRRRTPTPRLFFRRGCKTAI